MRVAPVIELNEQEREELLKLAHSETASVRLVQHARIVLLAGDGLKNQEIAKLLDAGRVEVSRWRERYATLGLEGIERDLPRGAPPMKVDVAKLVELTGTRADRCGAGRSGCAGGGDAPRRRLRQRPAAGGTTRRPLSAAQAYAKDR